MPSCLAPMRPRRRLARWPICAEAARSRVTAFITDGASHRQQFWPVGAIAGQAAVAPVEVDPVAADPAVDTPVVEVMPAEETVREAKASEAALDADGRKALQTAMAWYGFYDGGIDGAFGPGTRNSMAGMARGEWV